jgi:sugar lactone lactonase YvrE
VVSGVAADPRGNIYFSDVSSDRVYRIDANGILFAYAGSGTQGYSGDGGPATAAALYNPRTLAFDAAGNLYIGDAGNSRVRKVTPAGIISTIAGNGVTGFSGDGGLATQARLNSPAGVAVDANSALLIVDQNGSRLRRVDPITNIITTVAGTSQVGLSGDGGPAANASLYGPQDLTVAGKTVLIADAANFRLRSLSNGVLSSSRTASAP